MPHIDAFKHSLQEKMTEIGIRNGWKYDNYKKSFLIQEVRSLYRKKSSEVDSGFFPTGFWLLPVSPSLAVSGAWGNLRAGAARSTARWGGGQAAGLRRPQRGRTPRRLCPAGPLPPTVNAEIAQWTQVLGRIFKDSLDVQKLESTCNIFTHLSITFTNIMKFYPKQ